MNQKIQGCAVYVGSCNGASIYVVDDTANGETTIPGGVRVSVRNMDEIIDAMTRINDDVVFFMTEKDVFEMRDALASGEDKRVFTFPPAACP